MKISRILAPIPAIAYLWLAIAIFAASSSVTRKIIALGQTHLVHGRNPISLCNVLFIGNICAFVVISAIFYRDWRLDRIQQLQRSHWFSLTFVALLSGALAPAMIFTALDKTTVTNVVLIGRLEPPLTLALGMGLLRMRVTLWTIAGSIVTFLGVAVTALLSQPEHFVKMMGFHFGQGELLVMAGALCLSIATIIHQRNLRGVPFGILSGYRTFFGTIIFFCLAITLYGTAHFSEAFSPFLWEWMLVYAVIIVVLGQLSWFRGIKVATPAQITLANSCYPLVAMLFAYLIVGEAPTSSQYLGGSLILSGIILSLIGSRQQQKTLASPMISTGNGFKGL